MPKIGKNLSPQSAKTPSSYLRSDGAGSNLGIGKHPNSYDHPSKKGYLNDSISNKLEHRKGPLNGETSLDDGRRRNPFENQSLNAYWNPFPFSSGTPECFNMTTMGTQENREVKMPPPVGNSQIFPSQRNTNRNQRRYVKDIIGILIGHGPGYGKNKIYDALYHGRANFLMKIGWPADAYAISADIDVFGILGSDYSIIEGYFVGKGPDSGQFSLGTSVGVGAGLDVSASLQITKYYFVGNVNDFIIDDFSGVSFNANIGAGIFETGNVIMRPKSDNGYIIGRSASVGFSALPVSGNLGAGFTSLFKKPKK